MANTILPGYMAPIGDKYWIHFDHTGPASYTQHVAATTPTGGDIINASDLGVGGFDNMDSMMDSTGRFYAIPLPIAGGSGNAVTQMMLIWYSAVTATVGGQAQTAGSEVAAGTNLSSFALRIEAICI
jgi:hypothetical protein